MESAFERLKKEYLGLPKSRDSLPERLRLLREMNSVANSNEMKEIISLQAECRKIRDSFSNDGPKK